MYVSVGWFVFCAVLTAVNLAGYREGREGASEGMDRRADSLCADATRDLVLGNAAETAETGRA